MYLESLKPQTEFGEQPVVLSPKPVSHDLPLGLE